MDKSTRHMCYRAYKMGLYVTNNSSCNDVRNILLKVIVGFCAKVDSMWGWGSRPCTPCGDVVVSIRMCDNVPYIYIGSPILFFNRASVSIVGKDVGQAMVRMSSMLLGKMQLSIYLRRYKKNIATKKGKLLEVAKTKKTLISLI